jgi:hypothetical protein
MDSLVHVDGSGNGAAHNPEREPDSPQPPDEQNRHNSGSERANESERVAPQRKRRVRVRTGNPVHAPMPRPGELVIMQHERRDNSRGGDTDGSWKPDQRPPFHVVDDTTPNGQVSRDWDGPVFWNDP